MLGNYEEKIASAQEVFDQILKSVSGELQNKEIHEVEEELFRTVMKLGHSLLGAFIEKKGSGKDSKTDIPYHKLENWNYISIFGDLEISNAYFWEKGNKGISPIKKDLNLPKQHFSYLLQKWTQMFCVDISHEKSRKNLKEIFGIDIWSGQMESINKSASKSTELFYQNRKQQEQKEPLLVVQVDGKGIVMRENLKKAKQGQRQKKGEKNGKKKMSTVTAVYGIEKNIRSANDIIRDETEDKTRSVVVLDKKKGVIPQNKVVRATLKGKDQAFQNMAEEVALKDPEGEKDHIALMDGEKALANKTEEYLPGFTIILDLFHVMERLWSLSYFFHKEGSDEALLWVRKYLKMFLTGKVGYAIGGIRQSAVKKGITPTRIEAMEKHLRYFETKKQYMKYDEYLKKGYPIGSGVIEGTCRSLVNDRMELSGMHWSEKGAEAMLELRSIKINGFWNEYWEYHISEQKESIYEWDSAA
jgi:hypothetical protein